MDGFRNAWFRSFTSRSKAHTWFNERCAKLARAAIRAASAEVPASGSQSPASAHDLRVPHVKREAAVSFEAVMVGEPGTAALGSDGDLPTQPPPPALTPVKLRRRAASPPPLSQHTRAAPAPQQAVIDSLPDMDTDSDSEGSVATLASAGSQSPPARAVPAARAAPRLPGVTVARFDGASRGNPGPAGWGIAIFDERGQCVHKGSGFGGAMTNNEAEYTACYAAIIAAAAMGAGCLRVEGDSQLVIRWAARTRTAHPNPCSCLHIRVTSRAVRDLVR